MKRRLTAAAGNDDRRTKAAGNRENFIVGFTAIPQDGCVLILSFGVDVRLY
jgi:hypothetical protein